MSDNQKPILISTFLPSHGIHYFEQICKVLSKPENLKETYDQYQLTKNKNLQAKFFDEAVYIFTSSPDELERRFPKHYERFPKLEGERGLIESIKKEKDYEKLIEAYKEITNRIEEEKKIISLDEAIKIFKKYKLETYNLWHVINHFTFKEQEEWLIKYSHLKDLYNQDKLKIHWFESSNSEEEDTVKITEELYNLVDKNYKYQKIYVNLYGCTTEAQIAWYYLCWSSPIFKNCQLLEVYDEKQKQKRFGTIKIREKKHDLFSEINKQVFDYEFDGSFAQSEAYKKIQSYLNLEDNFTILLLGPRGTGKNRLIRQLKTEKAIIEVNCGAIMHDKSMAISELFGHKKGAFTGADADKEGAFTRANGKILFLDEVHHLNKDIQALLLSYLNTDKDGNVTFKRLGSTTEEKSKFQLICATNKPIEYFYDSQNFLRDLFDRISQRIITLPSFEELRNSGFDKEQLKNEFIKVCEELKFKKKKPIEYLKNNDSFFDWLYNQPLEGNYRDLEKIAITVHDIINISDKEINLKDLEEELNKAGLSKQVEKKAESLPNGEYQCKSNVIKVEYIEKKDNDVTMIRKFKKEFAIFLEKRYGSLRQATDEINSTERGRKERLAPETLSRWKNLNV